MIFRRVLILALAGAACAWSGIYYVAPEGSDAAGDGSAARPWATLAHAAASIPDDGSTVLVRDGVYRGRVRLSRRFSRRAVFRAEHAYRARLENSAPDERVVAVAFHSRAICSSLRLRPAFRPPRRCHSDQVLQLHLQQLRVVADVERPDS
jgi:hypothetical protein